MTAWEGVDLAVIREANQRSDRYLLITLDRNVFGGQKMLRIDSADPFHPRRKPVPVVPGPLVGASHADLLRVVADILDGTIKTLTITQDPACAASTPVPQAVAGTVEPTAAPATRTDVGMCRCGHVMGEHDGECTGLDFALWEGPPLQCNCTRYLPAGGAS